MRLLLTLAAIWALTVPPAHATPAAQPIIARAIDGFVRPAYGAFHDSTTQLKAGLGKLCAAPSAATLAEARQRFGATVAAWARADIIRFGPVSENNRLERILFWPDRKGTGLKQVQAALAQRDATAADAAALAGKSVAMQGLGALEFILFGTDSDALATPAQAFRCAYGAAVAGNLDTMAGEIDEGWAASDGIAALWARPSATNPLYHDDAEALGELLSVFVNGLELVRDVRLDGFLGTSASDDKPRQALFWRSGATVAALGGAMKGMHALFDAADLASALAPGSAWIAQSIDFEFGNAAGAARAVDGPIADVLQDPVRRGKLDYLRVVTTGLSDLFGKRLAAEFGVTAGFSSLDGD